MKKNVKNSLIVGFQKHKSSVLVLGFCTSVLRVWGGEGGGILCTSGMPRYVSL